ncbi:MAG: VanZ family protein [Sphaerochaetaceae bacterium]|nr:VanZ family protein [Sphaerochaetaceae bacterium]MDC7247149.1 VanZ family protein [Sphaerochaetaceae bacterium]
MRIITAKSVRIAGWVASPFILALIIFLSLLPPSQEPSSFLDFPFGDKIAHMAAYTAVAFAFSLAFLRGSKTSRLSILIKDNICSIIATFVFIVTVGGVIEIIQPLLGRSREMLDLIFDAIGTSFGILCGILVIYGVTKGDDVDAQ